MNSSIGFSGLLKGLNDRRGAADGVGFPVTLQDWYCAKNRRARICENDGIRPDIRLVKS